MSTSHEPPAKGDGLRERHVAPDAKSAGGVDGVDGLQEVDKEQKTFGRTPDGTIFTVPHTHDMVSQLLDPRQPKNLSDAAVLAVIAGHILLLYILPRVLRVPVFAIVFLFWRACYNVGIGYLLRVQSNHRQMETWAKQWKLFENPASGNNPRPWLYDLLKSELEAKIPEDYRFEEAPIEYNTWLVFRRVVDLILMCDFSSYCLFAIACGSQPAHESFFMFAARWTAGLVLFGFNLWVKLDAHRVVKDYAWYWGDFFYLIDQELTFDGVFEMAPHPMYSVGYAGYYGISMMASSYAVLFISIIAHAAQFAFLILIENPHIEKIYNPPTPRARRETNPTPVEIADENHKAAVAEGIDEIVEPVIRSRSPMNSTEPSNLHNLMGLKNIDPYRITDVSIILLLGYMSVLTFFTPCTPVWQALFVLHAAAWRLWYTVGLGIILDRQSNMKWWTRHFVKYGDSTEEAWRQWKGMYHLSMSMAWLSFVAAAWKSYSSPPDWAYGLVLLRHVVGFALVALQIWTTVSIYESLSEFGWFFGDFFFDHAPKLTYSGIYRYLNNPERILGLAGVWGAVFITNSKAVFFLALLSHMLALGFIQFVEKPHMQKLYGQSLRKEAGLTKTFRKSLPPPLKLAWQGSVDKVLGETGHFVEEFLDAARPKLAAGVSTFVRDTTALFHQYPARLTVTRIAPDLAGYNPKDYSLTIEGTPSSYSFPGHAQNANDGAYKSLTFDYGAPIKVKWTAPANHSNKDWIGLYMVADNASRDVTRLASAGRWIPTTRNEYDSSIADSGILVSDVPVKHADSDTPLVQGEMMFSGDKLFWTHGVFEFRYHHDGKHNVMAISLPFNVRLARFDEDDTTGPVATAIEDALLPVVRNCFDRDPEIAPDGVEDGFGGAVERDGKFARRVVFAIKEMFGVEFASGVVVADGNVRNLAWRIWNAKKVLAPYSMSSAKGTSTPTPGV